MCLKKQSLGLVLDFNSVCSIHPDYGSVLNDSDLRELVMHEAEVKCEILKDSRLCVQMTCWIKKAVHMHVERKKPAGRVKVLRRVLHSNLLSVLYMHKSAL